MKLKAFKWSLIIHCDTQPKKNQCDQDLELWWNSLERGIFLSLELLNCSLTQSRIPHLHLSAQSPPPSEHWVLLWPHFLACSAAATMASLLSTCLRALAPAAPCIWKLFSSCSLPSSLLLHCHVRMGFPNLSIFQEESPVQILTWNFLILKSQLVIHIF